MARFSSSSSRSSSSSGSYGAKAKNNSSSGKRSPSACDEVAVRYRNGVRTVFHHSNFHASAIESNISNDFCKNLLQRALKVSLFGGPDVEFRTLQRTLLKDCGVEVEVGSSKNGSSGNDSKSAQD